MNLRRTPTASSPDAGVGLGVWSSPPAFGPSGAPPKRFLPRRRRSLQLTTQCSRLRVVGIYLPQVDGCEKATKGLSGF